jgi:hypothetical protein
MVIEPIFSLMKGTVDCDDGYKEDESGDEEREVGSGVGVGEIVCGEGIG